MHATAETEFLIGLTQLATKLSKKLENAIWLHGIGFTEFAIMYELARAPEMTLPRVKLAEIMGLSASGVTRLLAPMEKNHITERETNPRDARMSLVKLSRVGQQLYGEALVSFANVAGEITAKLSDTQLQKLRKYSSELL
ncbi:MAG: MarR family transcriptional regulator [Gammaproteobacteria bacterium]